MLQGPTVLSVVLAAGLLAVLSLLAAVLWSISVPSRRVWPPKRQTAAGKATVWALTLVAFGCAAWLGIGDWNAFQLNPVLRWGVGLPLIIVGNVIVWMGVLEIGFAATSGEATGLRTGGLYRYSRNPQYVADMAMVAGWAVLSASSWLLPLAVAIVALLALTPLAEEAWLREVYGPEYARYRQKVRRYL
ncbi:MAG: DUF1295 domain-containing protein [Dehalococcoidia bacterium]|nr:DUF1295 domain-containing protein [Dehalococcoidia bacterium]